MFGREMRMLLRHYLEQGSRKSDHVNRGPLNRRYCPVTTGPKKPAGHTHPTLVRPDRCETIYIRTGDCGRLTHERGGQVATK